MAGSDQSNCEEDRDLGCVERGFYELRRNFGQWILLQESAGCGHSQEHAKG